MAVRKSADSEESEIDSERTCVGCRERAPREALLRFVVADIGTGEPALVPDVRRRLPGRGVSVHPTRACVELGIKKGGFARAMKRKPAQSADELCDTAAQQYLRRAEALVLAAMRARKVSMGTDAVRGAMGRDEVALLVVARDAEGRREELEAQIERLGGRAVVLGDKASLGRMVGREEIAVIGIQDPSIAREVVAAVARATELSEAE